MVVLQGLPLARYLVHVIASQQRREFWLSQARFVSYGASPQQYGCYKFHAPGRRLAAARGFPSIIGELDLHRGEVRPVVRRAVASLFKLQGEGDVRARVLDRIELDDGIHSPQARGIPVSMARVVSGVVNPKLGDL